MLNEHWKYKYAEEMCVYPKVQLQFWKVLPSRVQCLQLCPTAPIRCMPFLLLVKIYYLFLCKNKSVSSWSGCFSSDVAQYQEFEACSHRWNTVGFPAINCPPPIQKVYHKDVSAYRPVVMDYNSPLPPHTHFCCRWWGNSYFGVVWKIYSVGQAVKSMKRLLWTSTAL